MFKKKKQYLTDIIIGREAAFQYHILTKNKDLTIESFQAHILDQDNHVFLSVWHKHAYAGRFMGKWYLELPLIAFNNEILIDMVKKIHKQLKVR